VTTADLATPTSSSVRERGAGLIGAIAGVTVFLALLTVAVQIIFNLYTASVVTSATYDAARQVALDPTQPPTDRELAAAERYAQDLLGGVEAQFDWDLSDPDVIRLRVVADSPSFLLGIVEGAVGLDEVDRTVSVRVEDVQP
jgi:hypothetical protein